MGAACAGPSESCAQCQRAGPAEPLVIDSQSVMQRDRRVVRHKVPPMDVYDQSSTQPLHRGKTSTVLKAKHKTLGAWRALRVVRREAVDLEHWQRSLEMMACCDHPNIIRVFDMFEAQDQLAHSMELCAGRSLSSFSVSEPAIRTEATFAVLVRQMLSAVAYLHSQKVCHGCLQPDIFLFSRVLHRGMKLSELCIKLVDAGFAASFTVTEDNQLSDCSVPTWLLSSPWSKGSGCRAPEQRQSPVVSPTCDVWAVGAIAFFLVSCEWPKLGTNYVNQAPPALVPEKVWGGISRQGRSFVSSCLVIDRQMRPRPEALLNTPWMGLAQQAYEKSVHQEDSQPQRTLLDTPLLSADIVVDGFRKMAKMHDLERAAWTAVAHYLPEEKIAHLRRIFMILDKNGDGKLTVDEIVNGLCKLGKLTDREGLVKSLSSIDTDGNGCIDLTEFIAATYACRQGLRDEICCAAFRIFDEDASGKLTVTELENAMGTGMGPKNRSNSPASTVSTAASSSSSPAPGARNPNHIKDLLATIDRDGNGEIDLEEFKSLLRCETAAVRPLPNTPMSTAKKNAWSASPARSPSPKAAKPALVGTDGGKAVAADPTDNSLGLRGCDNAEPPPYTSMESQDTATSTWRFLPQTSSQGRRFSLREKLIKSFDKFQGTGEIRKRALTGKAKQKVAAKGKADSGDNATLRKFSFQHIRQGLTRTAAKDNSSSGNPQEAQEAAMEAAAGATADAAAADGSRRSPRKDRTGRSSPRNGRRSPRVARDKDGGSRASSKEAPEEAGGGGGAERRR